MTAIDRIIQAVARLRGKSVEQSWTFEEEMFIDDDTPPEMAAKYIAQEDSKREDVL